MEIITSHQRTDFDGLAAMVAAQKLYPQAVMVFSGKQTNNVKEFMALYRDRITIKYAKDIDKSKVTKVIMVDTRVATRVGAFADLVKHEDVEVLIYDHHLNRKQKLKSAQEVIEPIGATTTILVNRLQKQGVELTSFEATLFALGIYEDTGCLVYKSTTAQDAKAVAYLLEAGANLEIVEDYIEYSLDRKQQQLFNKLLDSLHQVSIKGFDIDIFQAEVDEYIPDIALLAHKLNELHNADALFVLVKYNQKILIIGRSNDDNINVAEVLKYFGGGGHDRAASATIKDNGQNLFNYHQEVLKVVKEKVNPGVLVDDVMSSPVKTVTADTSMEEADRIMLRYGYSGLVVKEDNEVVGIISRRDIDKVRSHGLLHAPVKGYMSTNVVTTRLGASLKEVQDKIVDYDIGRLPVLDLQGELVGIVTRSDLLKLFYGKDDYLQNRQNLYGRSLVKIKEKRYNVANKFELVDGEIINLLQKAGSLADDSNYNLYVVGGFVRDLLLDKINLDLDLVVEGDGIEFARQLSQKLKGKLNIHHEFGTAIISLQEIKLDIATARVEYYAQVASLPEVEPGSLQQDLFRRDFTINALAIQLNKSSFGQLVDYFNGKSDLEAGMIRLLHNFSLSDDPTRIFRGIRFASRYNYQFENRTEELIRQAIELDVIEKLSTNRLFNKLKNGLQDENPVRFINLIQEYNILSYISSSIIWNQDKDRMARNIPRVLQWLDDLNLTVDFDEWLLYLVILVLELDQEQIEELKDKFSLNINLYHRLLFTLKVDDIIKDLRQLVKNSDIYYLLKDLAFEDILLILIKDFSLQTKVKLYLEELQGIGIEVSGEDIIELGYNPGPFFKEILQAVKRAKLDGKIEDYQEELSYLQDYIQERGGYN